MLTMITFFLDSGEQRSSCDLMEHSVDETDMMIDQSREYNK
jgi:hypothetical protein